MIISNRILEQAKELGACRLADVKDADVPELARLFFTPQGREFCLVHDFPTMADFRQFKAHHCGDNGIHVDCGAYSSRNEEKCGLVGKTSAELEYDGVRGLVVLMHGATATIKLKNYAVVTVEKKSDSNVEIINEDNTGIVLW
ncbi:MAG: hypothetical protein MJZ41_07530 [Bacteroidaceae bacterium]|nr:hypothetical protein [Bacteroidaceae bacterium]